MATRRLLSSPSLRNRTHIDLRRRFASSSSSQQSEDAQRRAYQHYYKKHSNDSTHDKNVQLAWYAAAAVVGALGATYASVPLYKLFCQVTGFGGTTQRVELGEWAEQQEERESTGVGRVMQGVLKTIKPSSGTRVHTWTDEEAAQRLASLKPVENGRLITVRFDSTVGDVLPWTFEPVQLDVKVVPGETALSFFRVSNLSDKPITGVATYNVHPPKAGLYFSKIQCFCFEEQRLLPGETVDMPVFFFIDPEFVEDAQLQHVHNITLSYTFFQTDVEDDDDEETHEDEKDSEKDDKSS